MDFIDRISQKLHIEKFQEGILIREGYRSNTIIFSSIKPMKEKIAFIDGGNASLIDMPELNVSMLRIAYGQDSFTIDDYFLVTYIENEKYLSFLYDRDFNEIEIFEFEDDIDLFTKVPIDIKTIPNVIRRILEIRAIDNFKGKVLMDGNLEFHHEKELESFNRLKNKKVFALAKSSDLILNNGISLERYCMKKSEIRPFVAYDLLISNVRAHPAKISCACLNKRSKYAFRIDTYIEEESEGWIGSLIDLSNDSIFPGYPYGLIKVDEYARIANSEREYEKIRLLQRLGDYDIRKGSHSILDSIKF